MKKRIVIATEKHEIWVIRQHSDMVEQSDEAPQAFEPSSELLTVLHEQDLAENAQEHNDGSPLANAEWWGSLKPESST